mmetsp:Transcript_7605/g.11292  ORF Transcript_7605/g.11292 Transcript_7605/m.11292 type:complete len:229 (+) Transcript_7605:48-734(+)
MNIGNQYASCFKQEKGDDINVAAEELLNKLDEFGEHLDNTHNYSSNTCGKVIPQLLKEKENLVQLFNQIDILENYVMKATKRVHLLNLIVNDVELGTKTYSKYVPSILRKKPTKSLDRIAKEYNMKEFFTPCHPSALGFKDEILIEPESNIENIVETNSMADQEEIVDTTNDEDDKEEIVEEKVENEDHQVIETPSIKENEDSDEDDSDDEAGGGMITFGEDSEEDSD